MQGLKDTIHLYSVTIAVYAASGALSSQTGPAYSRSRSLNPQSRTVACSSHTAVCNPIVCRLMVSTSVIHVNTLTTTHLPTRGMGG